MKLLIAASEIPNGSIVTGRTVNKEYILTREIKIYGSDPKEILAKEGAVFLSDGGIQFNAFPGDKELLWVVEEEDLLRWLQVRNEATFQ